MVVFTFHGLGPVRRALDDGERNCWLEQDQFEAMLDAIGDHPRVRLTFDDGNASDAAIALPALLHRGLHATFFVCSGRVDRDTFLTTAQMRELTRQGMTIGSHGIHHVDWRQLAPADLQREVTLSRAALEGIVGVPVRTAACPFGSYDRRVLRALHTAGYEAVYTSDDGTARDTQWLRARNTVTRQTSVPDARRLAECGFSSWNQWMTAARTAVKQVR